MTATHASLRPLAAPGVFARRVLRGAVISLTLVGAGLGIGAAGYHLFEGLPWLDAALNAAMLLSGEGPIAPLHSVGGKWFAIVYSVFSGVLFITATSALLAPVLHRFLHRFHLELADDDPAN